MGTKALLTCLADIARAHDASISQVALNWLLARDSHVIPIPGATKPVCSENLNAGVVVVKSAQDGA
jgi:aryl-alcohol dehydrogenase-like predicted oxidoreductase